MSFRMADIKDTEKRGRRQLAQRTIRSRSSSSGSIKSSTSISSNSDPNETYCNPIACSSPENNNRGNLFLSIQNRITSLFQDLSSALPPGTFFLMLIYMMASSWLTAVTLCNILFSHVVTAFAATGGGSRVPSYHATIGTTAASAAQYRLLTQQPNSLLARSSPSFQSPFLLPRTSYHHFLSQKSPLCGIPRGGATVASAMAGGSAESAVGSGTGSLLSLLSQWNASPQALFNSTLAGLALVILMIKIGQKASDESVKSSTTEKASSSSASEKPAEITAIQRKFLPVFWLLRSADWLQGPYFYEVYASKMFNGETASMTLISRLFLTGFASTALFGPSVGRAADQYGRKKATLAFCLIYGLGALSTKSPLLQLLFVGRILSGIGTSLLFSAPESWLVGEAQASKKDPEGKYLGETFGLAYAGDAIVAICAGQMAGIAAANRGPTGPFELSATMLFLGGLLTTFLWGENKARSSSDNESGGESSKPSITEAIKVIQKDPKIMLLGGVQSLFEAAMYIFVLQWPPAITAAIAKVFGESASTPYGTIFSCFMASCLLGSTLFGQLAKTNVVSTEQSTTGMLLVATCAMAAATFSLSHVSLPALVAAFFAFEACVGMYFPSIGTLRSRYVPDSHRSVIMNLFGIPLNVLVVTVFLSIGKLGVGGALSISTGALSLATLCMFQLRRMAANQQAETS